MRILLVTQYYWPENSRVTDIAESLQKEGNEVTVLTGLPNYPQGYIYEGYEKKKNRIQFHNNVKILRAKIIERRHNLFNRVLNYYSFPYYGCKLAKKIKDDFDVVLAIEESPIMLVKPAITYAKKHKKPLIMYEMDLWPESLLAGGIKENSLIFKHYRKVSARIYSSFNKIIVSTKEHIPYIRRLKGCEDLDIDYLAQYADSIFEETICENVDNGIIDLMFAGNVGKAQSVDTIIKAASLLNGNSNIAFHIVGSGSELKNAKRLAEDLKLTNVVFYGQRPLGDMPNLYKIADAMLVTLEDKPYANTTIPGKVQSYMAFGKPVIGSINGSCSNFIYNNQIGYVCPACDYKALADLLSSLSISDLREIGEKSRQVYKEKYSKKTFISQIISVLESFNSKKE